MQSGHSFRKDYSQPRTVSTYSTRNSTTELRLHFCTATASQQNLILKMLYWRIEEPLLLHFIKKKIFKATDDIWQTKSSKTAIKWLQEIIFW